MKTLEDVLVEEELPTECSLKITQGRKHWIFGSENPKCSEFFPEHLLKHEVLKTKLHRNNQLEIIVG